MNQPFRPVSLNDCDRESIHVPGSIQAHGSLLALDETGHVVAWSEDLEAKVTAIEGRPATLADVIGPEDAERLAPAIAAGESRPILPIPLASRSGKALVHRNAQGVTLVEFESPLLEFEDLAAVLSRTQEITQQLRRIDESEALCQALARAIRELTGFDRVMIYRFADDWHGWVVAEDRDPDVDSFHGTHFPASDIPAQARALYERNPVRLIADVGAAVVPLRTRPSSPDPLELDLSHAVLRSVSPIHVRYLQNMGVGASMSLSLLRGRRLWGLVACHHRTARSVPFEVRQACELLSQVVSGDIELRDELEHSRQRAAARASLQHLAEHLVPEGRLGMSIGARAKDLVALLPCDALVVSTEHATWVHGAEAPTAAIEEWLSALPVGDDPVLWSSHALPEVAPAPFDPPMAGALVIRTANDTPTTIAWLRRERVQTVRWAGDPRKPVVTDEEGMQRLHPRESFAAWVEEVRGTSAPWTVNELETARELETLILSPAISTAFQLREQSDVLAELNAALQTSNEELERFAYVASHDLRAPLRAVRNIVSWLVEDEADRLSEQARDYLGLLVSRVDRMDRMMIDLLAYARAGREEIVPERIDLNELVNEVNDSVSRPVELKIEVGELPTIRARRVPLHRILLNLVNNAVRHHDRERGRISVQARLEDDATLEVVVADDGPGIPPEHRERVFEMFTTLESRDVVEGSGIGLAVVRRYARSLAGDVRIENASPRGTRIVVRVMTEPVDE